MTGSAKRKGDAAEREVAALLNDLLGLTGVRRKLGAGRQDDQGDIDGVPDCTVQVANYKDIMAAIRQKVPACVEQQARAGDLFGVCFIRRPGGQYLAVMTPEQWATLYREATTSQTGRLRLALVAAKAALARIARPEPFTEGPVVVELAARIELAKRACPDWQERPPHPSIDPEEGQ